VTCEMETTVHGYFDGELDAVRAAEFERHLEKCLTCQAELERLDDLRKQLKQSDLYVAASPVLRERIRLQIGTPVRQERKRTWSFQWILVPAFSAAVLLLVFWGAVRLVQPHTYSAQITSELIDAHVRSLQPGHLMDVQSTDQHTVKPWFDGKLDFIPPVVDHTEQGFPLVGGRLDVVDGQNIAALVYGRRKHLINLFVWPDRKKEMVANSSGSRNGYNWLAWSGGDMRFCLVSDTSADDLRLLQELIRP
jgi:anti-sigma factor RsiW